MRKAIGFKGSRRSGFEDSDAAPFYRSAISALRAENGLGEPLSYQEIDVAEAMTSSRPVHSRIDPVRYAVPVRGTECRVTFWATPRTLR